MIDGEPHNVVSGCTLQLPRLCCAPFWCLPVLVFVCDLVCVYLYLCVSICVCVRVFVFVCACTCICIYVFVYAPSCTLLHLGAIPAHSGSLSRPHSPRLQRRTSARLEPRSRQKLGETLPGRWCLVCRAPAQKSKGH